MKCIDIITSSPVYRRAICHTSWAEQSHTQHFLKDFLYKNLSADYADGKNEINPRGRVEGSTLVSVRFWQNGHFDLTNLNPNQKFDSEKASMTAEHN